MADGVAARFKRKLEAEAARKTINGGKLAGLNLQKTSAPHFEQLREQISGRELDFVWSDESKHIHDATSYLLQSQAASRLNRIPLKTPLGEYSDADLIMHMINRGYACMKMPKEGGLPEVLREQDR